MSNVTTQDITFEVFEFYIPKVLILIISALSAFGNSNIIWATISRRSLRNPCNYFIAFAAVGDFSAQGVHYINTYYSFAGIYPPLGTCWRLIVFPYCMFNTSFISTFFIGVDRFICIAFPTLYHKFTNSKSYVPSVGIIALIYSFIVIPFSHAFVIENETLPQYDCGWGSFIYKDNTINTIINYTKLSLCFGMLAIYTTTWTVMRFKNASSSAKKIMKSLTVITIVIGVTWPVSMVIITIAMSDPTSKTNQLWLAYGGVLINVGIAVNYFIFYAFSKEYRYAFQRQLSFLPWCKSRLNKSSGTMFVTGVKGHSALVNTSFH